MHTDDFSSEPLADYRQHYGLAIDPFTEDPEFPFFGGAGRRQLLENLLHHCQFSASLLAVLGDKGTGKTRLSQALLQALGGEQDICCLTARKGSRPEQVFADIARGLGLQSTEPANLGQLLASLRRFGQSADDLDSLALIVIDDAHLLDEQTLGGLLSLLQGQDVGGRRLHIVLFAQPSLVNRLDQFGMADVLIHDFYLDSFSLSEAVDYLNFRLEMSDYLGPELFNEALVEPWWRQSEGQIPLLHDMAHQWLLESVSRPVVSQQRAALPTVHIIAVALLLGVLMLAFLYRGGDSTPEPQAIAIPQRDILPLDSPVVSTQEPPPVVEPESIQPAPREPDPIPEPIARVPAPTPVTPVQPAEPPSPVEPPAPAVPPTASAPPAPRQPAASTQIPEDEQVLLSWRASEYTIQLLGAGSERAVRDYVSRQPNRQQLLVFKTERQGKEWFVVVTGRYPDASSARAAINSLPDTQRQSGPWPRALSGVHKEIEAVRFN